MTATSSPLRVLIDGSPLRDGRREAGIGRYVVDLERGLSTFTDVRFRVSTPKRTLPESWIRRWALAQPTLLKDAALFRPDVLHATATDPVLGWPLRKQVVTVHDVVPWTTHLPERGTPTWRYLQFQRRRFPRVGGVIVLSDDSADAVATTLRVPPERIHLIPPGIDGVFTATPGQSDVADRRATGIEATGYVLWVGSMQAHDPRKGIDDLVRAMASLGEAAPPLVLAGRRGPEADRVAELARTVGVHSVRPGYVSDAVLASLYRGAGVFVMPSRFEGFGLPMLEAMACGAPVVACSGGNLKDLGKDAALLVDPGDVVGIARAIRSVIGDPSERARLSAAGRERATGFSAERAATRTAEVYRKIETGRLQPPRHEQDP